MDEVGVSVRRGLPGGIQIVREIFSPQKLNSVMRVTPVAEREVNEAARSLPGSPRVINLEPTCLEEVFDCIAAVGSAVGMDDRADCNARLHAGVSPSERVF